MRKLVSLKRLSKLLKTNEGTMENLINSVNPSLLVRLPARAYVDLFGKSRKELMMRLVRYCRKRGLEMDLRELFDLAERDMMEILRAIGHDSEV